MPTFDPQPGEQITLDQDTYQVMPHPAQPAMAFGQEGRKAIVFQLSKNGGLFALKIFKRKYRQPLLVETCDHLSQLALPGLEVCRRRCLTPATATALLQQFPEMEYAVLMPWIRGSTWFDILITKTPIDKGASQKIAKNTATVLAELEQRGYAHCDVAAANVIVNTMTGEVNFIDVEDMFGPGLPSLGDLPSGTDGYHHRTSRASPQGQWCGEGDRFSSAVLLAEMLAWHDPRIRQQAEDDHYFAEDELQNPDAARYRLMLEALGGLSPSLADCFARAWLAPTLADCPALSEWAKLVEFPFVTSWSPIQAPSPQQRYNIASWTPIPPEAHQAYAPSFIPIGAPTQPPKTPIYFRLTGARALAWQAAENATTYVVESANDPSFANPTPIYNGADTHCVDPDPSGVIKYYRIRGVNAKGASPWSNAIQNWS